jgi:hypothetical protein
VRMVEWVQFRAPSGFLATVEGMAAREGLNVSAFIRRAVTADVERKRFEGSESATAQGRDEER